MNAIKDFVVSAFVMGIFAAILATIFYTGVLRGKRIQAEACKIVIDQQTEISTDLQNKLDEVNAENGRISVDAQESSKGFEDCMDAMRITRARLLKRLLKLGDKTVVCDVEDFCWERQ